MEEKISLRGRNIAVLAADGFEKIELSVPLKALRLAGASVDIISLRSGRIRGVNLHEPAGRIAVTKVVQDADPADYYGLYIPGGYISPDLMRQSAEVREFVRSFDIANKSIASICHGPWVLVSAGLLEGRTITSWPGIRDDIVNAGAVWLDQDLVRDGNFLTSRGPQDLAVFVPAMVELFHDIAPAQRITRTGASSAPQRIEPPQAVLNAMKWMPSPSLRTAVGLGMVALGAAAMRRRRFEPATAEESKKAAA
ncbi:MAG TPA: type 1 glutamine amidotransferase domain-containing protein [Desulfuromonadaceae bacterium]